MRGKSQAGRGEKGNTVRMRVGSQKTLHSFLIAVGFGPKG